MIRLHSLLLALMLAAGIGEAGAQVGCPFLPPNYYIITSDFNPGTQVWNETTGAYVSQADAGYLAWVAAGCVAPTSSRGVLQAGINVEAQITFGTTGQAFQTYGGSSVVLTNPIPTVIDLSLNPGQKLFLPQQLLFNSVPYGQNISITNIGANPTQIWDFTQVSNFLTLPPGVTAVFTPFSNGNLTAGWTWYEIQPYSVNTALLNAVQSWAAAQTFPLNTLLLKGSSTGVTTLNSALSGAGNQTISLPTATPTDALPGLNDANTFVAGQQATCTNCFWKANDGGTSYAFLEALGGGESNGLFAFQNGTAGNIGIGSNNDGGVYNLQSASGRLVLGSGSGTPSAWLYASGGNYFGSSPSDPGANNSTFQGSIKLAAPAWTNTAPTISSGFCSTGTVTTIAASNGTAAFDILIGTLTCGSTGTIGMPTATNGWVCVAADVTTPASHAIAQTGGTNATVILTDYARTTGIAQNFNPSDHVHVACTGY